MATASKAQVPPSAHYTPECCPLCGAPNNCQLCTTAAYKGPCWCSSVDIPSALLDRIPVEQRNRACICRACVIAFQRGPNQVPRPALVPGDFYFTPDGKMVFTAAYHVRRGYCCENDCRHCPFQRAQPTPA